MLARLALVILLAAVPAAAHAQIFVSGGVASPMSPETVTNIYRSGYSFAIGFAMQSGSFPFARVRPFGSFQRFRTDPGPFEEQFENIDEVDGGEMPALYAGADLQLRLPFAAFTPFVAPSLGLAVFSIDDITADGITFNLREQIGGFAAGIGGGFAYSFTRNYEAFVEVQYVHAFLDGDDRTFVPVRMGVELGFDY